MSRIPLLLSEQLFNTDSNVGHPAEPSKVISAAAFEISQFFDSHVIKAQQNSILQLDYEISSH